MMKGIAVFLWLVPGLAAQTIQTCEWPKACGPLVKDELKVDWNAPQVEPLVVRLLQVQAPEPVSLPYFTPVSEITQNPSSYLKGKITTQGVLVSRCIQLMENCFYIEDPDQIRSSMPVIPWLPLEVVTVPQPGVQRPMIMSDLVGKRLEVTGELVLVNLGPMLPAQSYRLNLENRGRGWRLVPDTNPTDTGLTIYVRKGEHVILHLTRYGIWDRRMISFDIPGFGVSAFFQGDSIETKSLAFDADRSGLFLIYNRYQGRSIVGRLIVEEK